MKVNNIIGTIKASSIELNGHHNHKLDVYFTVISVLQRLSMTVGLMNSCLVDLICAKFARIHL